MTNTDPNHSSPWVAFTYVSFFVSLAATAGGSSCSRSNYGCAGISSSAC